MLDIAMVLHVHPGAKRIGIENLSLSRVSSGPSVSAG